MGKHRRYRANSAAVYINGKRVGSFQSIEVDMDAGRVFVPRLREYVCPVCSKRAYSDQPVDCSRCEAQDGPGSGTPMDLISLPDAT